MIHTLPVKVKADTLRGERKGNVDKYSGGTQSVPCAAPVPVDSRAGGWYNADYAQQVHISAKAAAARKAASPPQKRKKEKDQTA